LVGAEERVIWSDRTVAFTGAVKAKLSSMKIEHSDADIEKITRALAEELQSKREYPNWLSDKEFEGLCRKVLAGAPKE